MEQMHRGKSKGEVFTAFFQEFRGKMFIVAFFILELALKMFNLHRNTHFPVP